MKLLSLREVKRFSSHIFLVRLVGYLRPFCCDERVSTGEVGSGSKSSPLPSSQSNQIVRTCCTATFCGCVRALPPHNTIQLQREYLLYCHILWLCTGSPSPQYSVATTCVPVVPPYSVVVYGLPSPQYNPATTCVPVVLPHSVVVYGLSRPTIQSNYDVCPVVLQHSVVVYGVSLPTVQSSHTVCTGCTASFCGCVRDIPSHSTVYPTRSLSPQYSLATTCVSVVLPHSVVVYGLSLPTIQSSYNVCTCCITTFCGSVQAFSPPQYNPAKTLSLPTIQSSYNVCTCFTASFCGCVHGIYLPTIQSSHNACTCCIATFCGCAQALSPHNTIHLQRVYLLYCNILWFCTGFLSTQSNLATMCAPVLLPHSVVMYAGSISPRYSLATSCVPVVLQHSVVVYGLSLPTIQSSYNVSTCCTATFCGCVRALSPHNTIQLQRGTGLWLVFVCTCFTASFCGLYADLSPHIQSSHCVRCTAHSVVVYGSPPHQSSTWYLLYCCTCCTATFCGCVRALPPHNTIQLQLSLSPQYNPPTTCVPVVLQHPVVLYRLSLHTIQSSYNVCTCFTASSCGYVRGIYLPTIQSSHDVCTCCSATFCGYVRALPPHNTIQLRRVYLMYCNILWLCTGSPAPQYNPATTCVPVVLHILWLCTGYPSPQYSLATPCVPVVLQHSVVVYGLSLPTIQSSYNALSPHNTIQLQRVYLLYCNILWFCPGSLSPQYNPATTCVPVVLEHFVVLYRLSLPTIQSSSNVCTCFTASFCGCVHGIYLPTIQSSHNACTCCIATFCGCAQALSPHNPIHLQRVYLLYYNILWFCTGFLSTQYNLATMCAPVLLPHSVVMYAGSISPRYSLATPCVPVVLPH
ncbi:hypothetical protein J6590_027432 [Homalodisca vitripennis]|nr:hypothetical protein J6590_027432 [Homalodisca vitripennis]